MKFRQIEVYWAVMRCGSVTAAAKFLNVSQPAVSKTIRQAESRLGLRLFQRIGGRLVPTPEAEALYPEVDRIYRQIDTLREQAGDLKSIQQGVLRVGTTSTLATSVLPSAVSAFQQAYPGFKVAASLLPANAMAERLHANAIEIGLALTALEEPTVTCEPIGMTRIACLLPAGHELERLERIRPTDLAKHPMISFGDGTAFGQALKRAFEAEAVQARTVIQVDLSLQAYMFAQRGCGVALVDTLLSGIDLPGISWRPFDPPMPLPIYLLHATGRPPSRAALAFRSFVVATLASLGHAPPR